MPSKVMLDRLTGLPERNHFNALKVIKRRPVRKNFNPMFGPYRKLFSMLEDRVVEWCNKAKSGMKEENGRIIN